MHEKFKSFLAEDALFFAILIVLIGVISFGLGRQSMAEEMQSEPGSQMPGVIFSEPEASQIGNNVEEGIQKVRLVGSRSGTKYHLLTCPGASQIKEENKVFFESISLAEAAGYTPAANCPGLDDL